jgi:hypothetical protein
LGLIDQVLGFPNLCLITSKIAISQCGIGIGQCFCRLIDELVLRGIAS